MERKSLRKFIIENVEPIHEGIFDSAAKGAFKAMAKSPVKSSLGKLPPKVVGAAKKVQSSPMQRVASVKDASGNFMHHLNFA